MKRLNPQTNQPFKKHDVREDGRIFCEYRTDRITKQGYFYERWCSPESFNKRQKDQRKNELKSRNTPKAKARVKKYYQENKEYFAQYMKSYAPEYYKQNKERILSEASEKHKKKMQSKKGRASHMLKSAKQRANEKKLVMTLYKEWIEEKLEVGHCELTGIAFDLTPWPGKNTNPFTPSIDRIDSEKGYTPHNCRVVLFCVNSALNSYGLKFMQPIFKKLAEIPV